MSLYPVRSSLKAFLPIMRYSELGRTMTVGVRKLGFTLFIGTHSSKHSTKQ